MGPPCWSQRAQYLCSKNISTTSGPASGYTLIVPVAGSINCCILIELHNSLPMLLYRVQFGLGEWPGDSPKAEVYDIANTPTKMVLLNERARPKVSINSLSVHFIESSISSPFNASLSVALIPALILTSVINGKHTCWPVLNRAYYHLMYLTACLLSIPSHCSLLVTSEASAWLLHPGKRQ